MFRVKICGVTTVADAAMAAEAGADAVGLNFYPGSRRFLSLALAKQIAQALPAGTLRVGVFVNATPEEIRSTSEQVGLDAVQLHGDEPPEALAELRGLTCIRAFRIGEAGLEPSLSYLAQCRTGDCMPRMVLLDAAARGAYGGTGTRLDWPALARRIAELELPVVLAGGLTADNVAEAVTVVRPAAVDTASGVERADGRKDSLLVQRFVRAACEALEAR